MKAPKIKLPNLKTPDKKITIKNRFLHKNLLSLIVVAVLAIGTGTAYGTLSSRDADRGSDPVNGVNQDRYQVLVSGKGYKLSKKQEKDYKLQKKQNQVNASNAAQNDPTVIRSSSGSRVFRSGSYNYRYRNYGSSYKPSRNPRITSNISDQISGLPDEPKAGEKLRFRVTAYAYPYGTKNAISSDNIDVKVEVGKEAKIYKEKSGSVYYEVELGEGQNKITIEATDKKTKKKAKLGPYKVKVGASSSSNPTDPTQGTETAETEVKVTVDFEFGSLESKPMTIDSNTSTIDVLSNTDGIKIKDGEIEYIDVDSYTFDDDQLREIYKKEENIDGDIVEEEYDEWFNEKVKKKVSVNDKVRLGKDYPFSSTKWTYEDKTGDSLKSGITLTFTLYED